MPKSRNDVRHRLRTQQDGDPSPRPKKPTGMGGGRRRGVSGGLSTSGILSLLGRRDVVIGFMVALMLLGGLGYLGYNLLQHSLRERVRTPVQSDRLVGPNATSAELNPAFFWGTYRPQLYFGLRYRSAHSLLAGLMWYRQKTRGGADPVASMPSIRHWCEQGDGLKRYGWQQHDGRHFGEQVIEDEGHILTTTFVKRPLVGDRGGDWTARVHVKPKSGVVDPLSVLFYFLVPDYSRGHLSPTVQGDQLVSLRGHTKELGEFQVRFIPHTESKVHFSHLTMYAPREDLLKETIMSNGMGMSRNGLIALMGRRDMKVENFAVHQMSGWGEFSIEIVFESGAGDNVREQSLEGGVFDEERKRRLNDFTQRFETTFGLKRSGYNASEVRFAEVTLSNLVGGIGYFYGSSQVQSPRHTQPVAYWEAPLFSATPSRSFFPRGFLWDEGFHNLLLARWDPAMSMDIICHWLDLLNVDGWIPREQILGREAAAKVPEQFVVQRSTNANPPTLFLALQTLLPWLTVDPSRRPLLRKLYPRLQVWYAYFNSTQVGTRPSSYRWRGRDTNNKHQLNPLTLTSGLDDYPRASHPSLVERHLDLRCWMALASRIMASLGVEIQAPVWRVYAETWERLRDQQLLDQLHWSEERQVYADYGLHTDRIQLQRPPSPPLKPGQQPPSTPPQMVRVVSEEPRERFVPYFGYVSLFPLLLEVLPPDSPRLGKLLRDLEDPTLLWTPFGLRSLAPTSTLYAKHNTEHDPPYWRGAVWINMNYLAVRALRHYASEQGPHQETARRVLARLRRAVVNNVMREFWRTGFLWEQYDDRTGRGQRIHPFSGWTALTTLIMTD